MFCCIIGNKLWSCPQTQPPTPHTPQNLSGRVTDCSSFSKCRKCLWRTQPFVPCQRCLFHIIRVLWRGWKWGRKEGHEMLWRPSWLFFLHTAFWTSPWNTVTEIHTVLCRGESKRVCPCVCASKVSVCSRGGGGLGVRSEMIRAEGEIRIPPYVCVTSEVTLNRCSLHPKF